MKIDSFAAPTMVTWQLTRDCNLACLHCCTDSAPGKALADEMTRDESINLAEQIVAAGVPYAMIVGGEPTIIAHFREICEILGRGGVYLKIETNGQDFNAETIKRLSQLPVRSIQISIDGATQAIYARQRVHGDLNKTLAACRAVRAAGLPLEITFAPTRINIHEAEAVIALALELGAFRFNTGALMRLGTAVKLWDKLEPTGDQYAAFLFMLERKEAELAGRLELCFRPFSLEEDMAGQQLEPAGTLLILPNGRVKVAAPLSLTCADLKKQTLIEAWNAYRRAWTDAKVLQALNDWAAVPSQPNDLPVLMV